MNVIILIYYLTFYKNGCLFCCIKKYVSSYVHSDMQQNLIKLG